MFGLRLSCPVVLAGASGRGHGGPGGRSEREEGEELPDDLLRDAERIGRQYEDVPEFEGDEEESSEEEKVVCVCEGGSEVAGKEEAQDECCFCDTACVCVCVRERVCVYMCV